KTFQWLTLTADAAFACAANIFKVDFQWYEFLAAARFVQDVTIGVTHDRATVTARTKPIDIEDIALVGRGHRAGDGQFRVAIDGRGQGRAQDHLRAHGDQCPRDFREPGVVANAHAQAANIGYIKDEEFIAGGYAFFIRVEYEHFPIATHHDAVGIDNGRRIVGVAVFAALVRSEEHTSEL